MAKSRANLNEQKNVKPFVPAKTNLKEFTLKALLIGILLAIILGGANAYLGMKAGLTVAATFPAAVVSMAILRMFKGSILEENISRTTASVGEALVAGAIFTIPAFVLVEFEDGTKLWNSLWEPKNLILGALIMLIGGTLGVLFVILIRKTMVEDTNLPFPESKAAAEIVKAGQKGATGAKYVFGGMGFAGLIEILKNSNGIQIIVEKVTHFIPFAQSKIKMFGTEKLSRGGILLHSPSASPLLMSVGYIVGFKISSVLFAGAVLGHFLFVPLAIFLTPELSNFAAEGHSWNSIGHEVWSSQIKPFAVGTMIVAAFFTLLKLLNSLVQGIGKALLDIKKMKSHSGPLSRLEIDLNFKKIIIAILILAIPQYILYQYFSGSLLGALILTIVLLIIGFLFSAVAGYLAGLIGCSNNPISGLTLSTLLISAILMVSIGVIGPKGVAAVLGVAGVICCAASIAGDMIQDLKVGQILGGTPWKMELGEIIGVIIAAIVIMPFIAVMDKVYVIGSENLPAPQAGLMALMAKGIVGGEMAWPLVIAGIVFAFALILINAPSPMLIAVGMYLPFYSTGAIFIGGIIKLIMDHIVKLKKYNENQSRKIDNTGILLASGFIAGESLMAVILAFIVLGLNISKSTFSLPQLAPFCSPWLGLAIFALTFYALIKIPLKNGKK
jgi:putative OPT family oligopeptide transporter